jgi:hypothetical protein
MYVCKCSILPHYPAISPPHSRRREANIKMDTGSTTRQPPNTASKAARPCIWYLRCAVDNLSDFIICAAACLHLSRLCTLDLNSTILLLEHISWHFVWHAAIEMRIAYPVLTAR